MSHLSYVPLSDRGVIAVGGAEAAPFLQGLISNDLERATAERAIYAALLTPQGKFLFDFVIVRDGERFLLETEAARLPALIQRLTMYRLRAKVTLDDVSDALCVAALLGERVADALDLPDEPGACRPLGGGFALVDPRLAALGGRALLPPDALETTLEGMGFRRDGAETYERHRLSFGVPDGSRDMTLERATLLESGFEELHGVDFKKGCFVGQELTARMKYRGLVRKRLMPVTFDGPAPEPGTVVRADGRDAGEIRSAAEGRALALLRLEQVEKARSAGTPLTAGETEVRPEKPDWVNF